MTKEELDARAETGKIGFDVNYGERRAETEPAVKNALQSFEDGIYRIFLNDRSLERLDEPLHILEEDSLTFVRLTMLAGRMWCCLLYTSCLSTWSTLWRTRSRTTTAWW